MNHAQIVENELLKHFQPRAISYVAPCKNGDVLVSLTTRANIPHAQKVLKGILHKDFEIKISSGESRYALVHAG